MKWNAYGQSNLGTRAVAANDFYLMDEEHGLYVLCDAVQDPSAKIKISEICARTVRETVVTGKDLFALYRSEKTLKNRSILAGLLQKAVVAAHKKVTAQFANETSIKPFTTLECLLLLEDFAIIAHVGDSRIYLAREGVLHQLTKDHRDASGFLERAIGALPSVQVDTLQVELNAGDLFFLCSASLSDQYASEELRHELEHDVATIPLQIEKTLKHKGSADVTTFIVIRSEAQKSADPNVLSVVKKTELLKKIQIFRFMTYQEITKVLSYAQLKPFAVGEVLLREGGPSDEMYILAEGEAEVIKGDVQITKRGRGDVFGEMGIFENVPRSASVRALTAGAALTLKRSELLVLLRQDSQICVKLLWALNTELNQRLRKATQAKAELIASGITSADQDQEVVEMEEVPFNFDS